jgi:hypothetical protein
LPLRCIRERDITVRNHPENVAAHGNPASSQRNSGWSDLAPELLCGSSMMKTARRLAVAMLVLAAAPVAAQPGADYPLPAPPPPPQGPDVIVIQPAPIAQPAPVQQQVVLPATLPPQNEKWEDVSHINGQVVPVGERGNYLVKKWKKTNIASNPIGWMVGIYGLSVSHAVHDNVAIRGDVNLIEIDDTSGYEIGASLPIYFKRVFSGPFIEPGIIVRQWDDDDEFCDFGCEENRASVGPSVVFGWHWTFDSGLNVAAAFGIMRNINDERMNEFDSGEEIEPSGYFRVGYAF